MDILIFLPVELNMVVMKNHPYVYKNKSSQVTII